MTSRSARSSTSWLSRSTSMPVARSPENRIRVQGLGQHGQVGPLGGRVQVGIRGAAPQPVALSELVVADPILGRSVEVVSAPVAGLLGRLQEGVHEDMAGAPIADRQRPADPMQRVGAALVVLGPQKVGQHPSQPQPLAPSASHSA